MEPPDAPEPQSIGDPQPGDLIALEFVVVQVFPETDSVLLARLAPVRDKVNAGLYGFRALVGALAGECQFRAKSTVRELPHALFRITAPPGRGRSLERSVDDA